MNKKVCVIGLGYIGLPTAIMFANHGVRVHGVDVNEKAIEMIQNKQVHIEETGLQERLEHAIDQGNFTASTTPVEADVYMIAVPSPINPDKTANLEIVREATASVVPYLKKGALVVLESTVPPKTVENVMLPELRKSNLVLGEELFVAHSPERVIPGAILKELANNDRIIGGIDEKSAQMTKELYEVFVEGTIHTTDATTAELVKVMENTYRDVNIAFANELAKIGETLDVNIWEAIRFANFHPRVNIHQPGPGVGGHCIAVDPWFIVELAPELSEIVKLSRDTNDGMPAYVANRTKEIIGNGTKVALLGLSFKGDIDDMRTSPSLTVIDEMEKLGLTVASFDPYIKEIEHPTQKLTLEEAVEGANIVVIVTDHTQFKQLAPEKVGSLVANKVIFDTKNILTETDWTAAGFEHYLLGNSKK
ncbi:nucleotide sugar dehydrogenase [Sporosarcina ureilytica]|uniref:UDP-N-acetyl-D-mannosamine dehydrogenase n=1 Tax=Sporosarcina ureilytica TaxID=298596 RepID=A0A1D8JJB1_9BACL|nr:nucleotide sugar dehydrogenase [Sporosarcina ureilytica]AOV08798.1 UDP-N-acetyl-D-mannosamine dehydrogenase [Sporosarcina ureilytica]